MQPLSEFSKEIKTPRLVLRALGPTRENAEIVFRAVDANREDLLQWQGHFDGIKNVDDTVAYLAKRAKQIEENAGVCFYIFRGNDLIGRIRFFDVQDCACEIGYWLIESATGYGFMTEALLALENELFKFGFDKIKLDIDAGNTQSENTAIRNGYKLSERIPMASWAKCVGKCDSLIYTKEKTLTNQ